MINIETCKDSLMTGSECDCPDGSYYYWEDEECDGCYSLCLVIYWNYSMTMKCMMNANPAKMNNVQRAQIVLIIVVKNILTILSNSSCV